MANVGLQGVEWSMVSESRGEITKTKGSEAELGARVPGESMRVSSAPGKSF